MVLASCTGNSTSTVVAPEQPSIVVDSVPGPEEAGLYVAQEKGFFRQQGLTLTIRPVLGAEAGIPDLQSGSAQLVGGDYTSLVRAQIAGQFNGTPASFQIVAAGSELQPGNDALYIMPSSRVKTIAGLVKYHATMGLDTPNGMGNVLYGALFADKGFSFGEVKPVSPAGGFPALLAMLVKGQVAASWLPEPYGTMAEQAGAVQLADFDQGAVRDLPYSGYFGSEQWVRAHPDTVAAFRRALIAGQQVADTDRGAVEQAMERSTGLMPLVAGTMTIETYPLGLELGALQRVPNDMFEFGLTPGLAKPYQIAGMVQEARDTVP